MTELRRRVTTIALLSLLAFTVLFEVVVMLHAERLGEAVGVVNMTEERGVEKGVVEAAEGVAKGVVLIVVEGRGRWQGRKY